MRYTLLLHYPEMTPEQLGAEAMQEGQRAFASYASALDAAGVLLAAEVLQSSASTTTVRVVDGGLRVQDGPFADTKEVFGGYYVFEAGDLDEAIQLAARIPAARLDGAVEVRPVVER